ncbi:MAG: hypothetical protein ACJAZ8_000555 [Planctomycetota bacterium]|jgi:hypothetical protein
MDLAIAPRQVRKNSFGHVAVAPASIIVEMASILVVVFRVVSIAVDFTLGPR